MTQGHPPKSKQSQLRNLVNSHFLDERWFDFHFLDNDFHFLDNRYDQARLRMHFFGQRVLRVNEYTA